MDDAHCSRHRPRRTAIEASRSSRPWIALGIEVIDLAPENTKSVDFPDYAERVGRAIQNGEADRGILVCGSGIGMCLAANKMQGIRASVAHDVYSAHQGVEHDDMNVLCLGSRVIGPALAEDLIACLRGCGVRSRPALSACASGRLPPWRTSAPTSETELTMKRTAPPNLMVVFGASGDLAKRKLMPALFHLSRQGMLPPGFIVLGFRAHGHERRGVSAPDSGRAGGASAARARGGAAGVRLAAVREPPLLLHRRLRRQGELREVEGACRRAG